MLSVSYKLLLCYLFLSHCVSSNAPDCLRGKLVGAGCDPRAWFRIQTFNFSSVSGQVLVTKLLPSLQPHSLYKEGNNTQDCVADLMKVEVKDLAESAVHCMLSKC